MPKSLPFLININPKDKEPASLKPDSGKTTPVEDKKVANPFATSDQVGRTTDNIVKSLDIS